MTIELPVREGNSGIPPRKVRDWWRDAVTVYRQRALFHPKGLYGHAYWTSMLPFHGIIFGSMLRNIRENAEQLERSERRSLPRGEPVDRAS